MTKGDVTTTETDTMFQFLIGKIMTDFAILEKKIDNGFNSS